MPPSSMICPDCNQPMNHHADKVDYTVALDNPAAADPTYGGLLEEVFTCPHCGITQTRLAS